MVENFRLDRDSLNERAADLDILFIREQENMIEFYGVADLASEFWDVQLLGWGHLVLLSGDINYCKHC
jgi:hypothetical protein